MTEESERTDGPSTRTAAYRTAIYVSCLTVAFALLAVDPVLAQENPICAEETETLVNMIEGFVQMTTGLGVMGLLVVWQGDSLMEMFTMGQDQQASFKRHKRKALKSATVLVLLGPLFTLMGSSMELPIADCVDLIPF